MDTVELLFCLFTILAILSTYFSIHPSKKYISSSRSLMIMITVIILFIVLFIGLTLNAREKNRKIYQIGLTYEYQGDYLNAMYTYLRIPEYGPSNERIDIIQTEYTYQLACKYEEDQLWFEAVTEFMKIKNFKDSKSHLEIVIREWLKQIEKEDINSV